MKAANTDEKLRELTLYIAKKCEGMQHFGMVKLNKILFFTDAVAYGRRGRDLTGSKYVRQPLGPVPARINDVRKDLERSGSALVKNANSSKRLIAHRAANMSIFSDEEIQIADEVISKFSARTGSELSDQSHRFPGWKLAQTGETIPLATVFLPEKPLRLTPAQQAWARSMVQELGGAVA